jgi:hypothetical protein
MRENDEGEVVTGCLVRDDRHLERRYPIEHDDEIFFEFFL